MSGLAFAAHSDQGAPHFYQDEGGLLGIRIAAGARGRWLGTETTPRPLPPGLSLTLSGQLRTELQHGEAEVVVVFWRDEPGLVLHSTQRAFELSGTQADFTPFACAFAVPPGVKGLRVDVRAWTGAGVVEARALRLVEDGEQPPPPGLPLPALPDWPLQKVSGYLWGANLCLVVQQEEAAAAETAVAPPGGADHA